MILPKYEKEIQEDILVQLLKGNHIYIGYDVAEKIQTVVTKSYYYQDFYVVALLKLKRIK